MTVAFFSVIVVYVLNLSGSGFIPAAALKCLQCNSVENKKCLSGTIEATECKSKNYTYCVTYIASVKVGNFFMVFRDCNSANQTNGCLLLPDYPNNKTSNQVIFCDSSCITDGCNRERVRVNFFSNAVRPQGNNLVIIALIVIVAIEIDLRRYCLGNSSFLRMELFTS